MGKKVTIPKGGSWQKGKKSSRYKARFIDGGKLCYKCNIVRELDGYRPRASICKSCQNELSRKRWEKEKQPLW